MKKTFSLMMVAVLIFSMATVAQAANSRALSITSSLYFDDTTAICSASASGNTFKDYIVLTVKYWRSGVVMESWTVRGYGYVSLSETAPAAHGIYYTMTVDVTFNGVVKPTITKTEMCPV